MYQNPSAHYDNADADESSLLVLTPVDASSSFSLAQNAVASKKNVGVPMMRAVIATCFLLVTLVVLYSGGRGSITASSGGISAALLLSHNQGASVYDPTQDYCFMDNDNAGKYCWYPDDRLPDGNWKGVAAAERGYSTDCGAKCTDVAPDPSGRTPCVPAGGSFSGMSETSVLWFFTGNDHPFQTCYEYLDTTKRCWSKSYYSDSPYPGWYQCVPKGGDVWHDLKGKLPFNYCDTPCQELQHQYH